MRPYRRNSPQAAARIVVLALLADGNVTKAELDVLTQRGAYGQLGLSPMALQQVLRDFCEDLLCSAQLRWSEACRIDPRTLAALMAEVDDPTLREKVLRLCLQVIDADDHVTEGESIVLNAAAEHWHLQHAVVDGIFHLRASLPS